MTETPVRQSSKFAKRLDSLTPIWSDLGKLGNNRVVRSSMVWMFVVPVLAKVLVPINSIELSLGGAPFMVSLSLPFSWKFLYGAALSFGIASILFSLWCPRFIKHYSTPVDLEEAKKGSRTLIDNFLATIRDEAAYRHLTDPQPVVARFTTDYLEFPDGKCPWGNMDCAPSLGVLKVKLNEGVLSDASLSEAFWFIHNFCEHLSPGRRGVISFLYGLGFVFLGIVVIENTYNVLLVLF